MSRILRPCLVYELSLINMLGISSLSPAMPTARSDSPEKPAAKSPKAPRTRRSRAKQATMTSKHLDATTRRGTRANWRLASDTKLVHTLEDQARSGNKAGNGWKQQAWVACARALAGSEQVEGGVVKDADHCASRWKSVRKPLCLCIA